MEDIFDLSFYDNMPKSEAPVYDNTSALMPSFPWLEGLNPEQKEAVTTTEGPVLVLSGAGTGKTRVLTTRLAYILASHKANPWECLVVTFTNRAAKEMKERVQNLIGDMAASVWLGTFHSVCVKILRSHAELVGLHSNFTILNEDDQKRLIKQISEAEGIDDKKYPPQSVVECIQRWKDKGLTVDKIQTEYKSNVITFLYEKYQARLIELNCVDFGDIILHALTILLSNPDVLQRYQTRFKYIMVDEYQDTNVSQYLLLRLLSQKYRNLCCVGDDDQSIYSWRGAEIENILRFNKDFTDAKVIRLERNYRSSANILAAASALISHNQGRLGKTLKVAENSPALACDNAKIKVVSNYSGEEEARYVAGEIENLHRSGVNYSQMAVLVRTAFQTREFEEKFISESIPYQVVGGPKFYERAEIRDAIAYFRIVMQPHDDLALERIINKPARGVGAKSVEKFHQMARAELAAVEAKCRTAEIDYHRQTRLRETQAVAAQKQESAESNYFLLKALLEREKSNLAMLLAGTRKEEIAQAEADVRAARAKVKIQKQALADAELFAPCDGVLRKRLLEIGEMANPQTPAFAIAMSSPKWVRTWLPESLLTRVRVGERALVLFDGADQPFEGWVGFVSPTAEFTPKNVETVELRTSLVYEVRVYVKDPRNLLKLGAPATVRFPGIPAL